LSDYRFDVFVSYARHGTSGQWVNEHFREILCDRLADELPDEPRVFLDTDMRVGVAWPAEIREALHRSKVMISVLSAPYFSSSWCKSELRTILERERLCGLPRPGQHPGLIIPLSYGDGEAYWPEVHARQLRSVKDFAYVGPAFRQSEKYMRFQDFAMELAAQIAALLSTVPEWSPDWPILEVPASAPPVAVLPGRQ
jgi:TIR domain